MQLYFRELPAPLISSELIQRLYPIAFQSDKTDGQLQTDSSGMSYSILSAD